MFTKEQIEAAAALLRKISNEWDEDDLYPVRDFLVLLFTQNNFNRDEFINMAGIKYLDGLLDEEATDPSIPSFKCCGSCNCHDDLPKGITALFEPPLRQISGCCGWNDEKTDPYIEPIK